ncbi:MAG: hypothetical protein ACREBE_26470, partial [bacterium]
MRASRIERWFWGTALLIVLIHPVAYLGMFAGDAEIHLVYGRSAASGHFFEFNPGEKSPGVTSPGYMLMLVPLFQLFPEGIVPVAVKILNVLFWYGSIGLVALLMRQLTSDRRLLMLAAVIAGLLPGSAYNATIGMESGVFGFAVLLTVVLAVRLRWFDAAATTTELSDVTIGVLLGCGCWLRPEGFVIAALFYLVLVWHMVSVHARWSRILWRAVVSAIPLAALAGGVFWFHHQQTGYWLPASGRARVLAGHLESWKIGPIFVSWKPLRLLALYLPLSSCWLLGCWWIARKRLVSAQPPVLLLAAGVSLLFFALYSTVLGSAHLGRYLIFVMPFVVVIAVLAAGHIWQARLLKAPSFALLALGLLTVWGAEMVMRRQLGASTELLHAMHASDDRARFSDSVESLLAHPAKHPIVLGLQE